MTTATPTNAMAFRSGLWAWVVFLLFMLVGGAALAQQPVPPLTARVTDLTQTLSPDQRQALEAKLAAMEAAKGSQLAVLIIPSTQPETIEEFGIRVAETWKLGRKGVDDGLLLLVAKEDRAVRIEVGYGLEGAIPDAVANRVIDEIIVPHFRDGDFSGGIDAGVDSLIKIVSGEPLPEPAVEGRAPPAWLGDNSPLLLAGLFVAGGILRALVGRLMAGGILATLGFIAAWWILGSVVAALIVALFVFIFTLGGGGGGGVYRGGGGSSGGGGYSGGGGGFGGGGASGRW